MTAATATKQAGHLQEFDGSQPDGHQHHQAGGFQGNLLPGEQEQGDTNNDHHPQGVRIG